jgi:hypothetical protein
VSTINWVVLFQQFNIKELIMLDRFMKLFIKELAL